MLYTNAKDLRSTQFPRSRFKGSKLPQYNLGGWLGDNIGSVNQFANMGAGTISAIDGMDGDLNPYASAGAGALKGAAMGAKLGTIVPGLGNVVGAAGGAIIGGAAGLIKERMQQKQLDAAAEEKRIADQRRKQALEASNLQSSKAILATYPTSGVADAGFMMAMGGPVNDPKNPPLSSYNQKDNYTPPALGKDNRLVYGEAGTGGANVNHLNLDPRLVSAGYNLTNDLNISDWKVNSMLNKYLDKSSKVAFYNEAQQLPFNRDTRTPISYHVGKEYKEAIEPIDNVFKKLSTLSDKDLKGLESELSKLSKPYQSLGSEKSIADKIIAGGKLAINQDWSGIKSYREKADLSKDDIIKLIYAREDAGFGERIALSGLRGIVKMKDFAYGGPTDPPPFDMSLLAGNSLPAPNQMAMSAPDVLTGYTDQELAFNRAKGNQVAFNNRANIFGENSREIGNYIKENPLDAVQVGLGAVAIGADGIPLAGTAVSGIADGINAGISSGRAAYYANKGDASNAAFYSTAAALDGAAAIPGLGNAAGATKIARLLNKANHVAHTPIHAAHTGAKAVTAYKAGDLAYGSTNSTYAMGGKIHTENADYLAEGQEIIQHAVNDRPDTDQNGNTKQLNSNTSKFVGDSHDAPSQGIGVSNNEEARIFSKRLYAPKNLVAKLNKL